VPRAAARGVIPEYTMPSAESVMATRSRSGPKPLFPPGVRICTNCGRTLPLNHFTPIRSTRTGYYGACRACRARRAWERNHPGQSREDMLARQFGRDRSVRAAKPKPAKQKPVTRTCTECDLVKPVTEFTRIKGCDGYYGRCRVCRARRARDKYRADAQEREKQKARVQRNRKRRSEQQ